MRSMIYALAVAASVCVPVSAVAYPSTFTSPTTVREAKHKVVFLTFVNYTSQDREIVVGNQLYKIKYDSVLHVYAPVGSVVRAYSETNSQVNGQELMTVAATDVDKSVILK